MIDFFSLHNFWQNEYHSIEVDNIDSEKKILFKFFLGQALKEIRNFTKAFIMDKKINAYVDTLKSAYDDVDFNLIEEVNRFFEADEFQGYIMKLDFKNIGLKFEAFFNYQQNSITTIEDKNGKNALRSGKNSNGSKFISSIVRLKVCYL